MSKRLSPDMERTIADRYAAGDSTAVIGRAMGISPQTAHNVLSRLGVPMRGSATARNPVVTDDQRRLAVEACEDGATREEAAKRTGISVSTVEDALREAGVELKTGRPTVYELDHSAFDRLTPESCYWLGFLWADGCVSRSGGGTPRIIVGLGEKDQEHLEKFRRFLKSDAPIRTAQPGKNKEPLNGYAVNSGPCVYFSVRSERLAAKMVEYGYAGKKPDRVPCASLCESRDFWRGAVDGDGWVSEPACCLGFCGQLKMVERFVDFMAAAGTEDWAIHPTESGIFKSQVYARRAAKPVALLYGDAVVALARKAESARVLTVRWTAAGSLCRVNQTSPKEECAAPSCWMARRM